MKILLVEDSATLRFAFEAHILEAGHTPITAENGEKAVQIVETEAIDMILMDVEMPGLDGFETTRLIREILKDNWIPIIFVTGKSDESSLEEGIRVGGDDYLTKPVSNVILQAKIKAMERIANMRSQLRELNAELILLSQHDGLTDLLNRRTFDERAAEAWRLASRSKQPLSILLFDIDHFKKYNDTYGHQAGDACIKTVADISRESCNRPGDVVARYGGEEFVVLLPNTDLIGARHIAERVRSKIEQENIEHNKAPDHGRVTVSVGGCVIKFTTGACIDELISSADEALYACKHKGRNTVQVNEFLNLHKVIYIDYSCNQIAEIERLLEDHCKLTIIDSDARMQILHAKTSPELVILAVKNSSDPSIGAYKKLREKFQLQVVPLLLVSAMDKSALKTIGSDLAANGRIALPLDPHQTIAKIDHMLVMN